MNLRAKIAGKKALESYKEPYKSKSKEEEESLFEVGQLIEAKFRGRGSYYRGTIKNISGDKCDIDYEDGDRDRNLSLVHVRKLVDDAGSNEKLQQRRRDRRFGNSARKISKDGEKNTAMASESTGEKEVVDSISDEHQVSFKKGDRVMARFRGRSKRFYRGVIAECHENDVFTIHYDDGDRDKELSVEFIRAIDSADLAMKDHLEEEVLQSEEAVVEDDKNKKNVIKVHEEIPLDSIADRDFTKVKVETAPKESVELAPEGEEKAIVTTATVPDPDAADGDVSFVVESCHSTKILKSPAKEQKVVVEQGNEKCYSGKGNRLYRGTVVGIKTIHLYEIEYPDFTADTNIPFGALRVPQGCTEKDVKVGTSVDVLSWQDRFPEV